MTGPREWRHAEDCPGRYWPPSPRPCTCGLSAVRDAIAAGHRVVIGPDGALADPAPVGLTEGERKIVEAGRHGYHHVLYQLVAIIDRLVHVSASVDPEEEP